ncbi:MAG: tandem-95 repeat protein, partial [Beijerinckiaceae bacterium]
HQPRNEKGKSNLLTTRPHRGTNNPTGSLLNENPGSNLSGNQQGEGSWTVDPVTGAITFTPEPDYNGTPTPIQYTVADDSGDVSTPATVSLTVTPVNDAPRPVDDSATTPEDTPVTIDVLANDADVDGTIDPTTVQIVGTANPGDPLNVPGEGEWTVDPVTGAITFTPEPDYNGTPTPIQYTVADDTGDVSTPATVSLTVTPVNDAPRPVDDSATTPEDTPVTIDVLANDVDVDGTIDPTSVQIVGTANPGDPLTVPGEGEWTVDPVTGAITFTPEPDYNGTPTPIQYTVADDTGDVSTPATVSLTVTPVNDRPVPQDDTFVTDEDIPAIIDVLGNDTDVDGDLLTVTAIDGKPAVPGIPVVLTDGSGTVTLNPDGSLSFEPTADYSGGSSFSYEVSDGQLTQTGQIFGTVLPVNDPPVVTSPIPDLTADDGTSPSYNVAGHFGDIDDDTLSYSATGLPPGLTLDPLTGVISGTLPADASQGGPYTVMLTADDGNGGTVSTSFVWNVLNPSPVAVDDTAHAVQGQPVTIDVLANDSDPDGDPIQVVDAHSPQGDVTINADGTITFIPGPAAIGTAEITYTISDGNGGTATATVRLKVDPAPLVQEPAEPKLPLTTPGHVRVDAHTEGFIVSAVNALNSLDSMDLQSGKGSSTGLDPHELVVTQAVNGIDHLNSVSAGFVGDQDLGNTIENVGRQSWGDRNGHGRDAFDTKPYGFSRMVQVDFGGSGRSHPVELFSKAEAHHFYLGALDRGANTGERLTAIHATLPGGKPLPAWMHVKPSGLIVIDKQHDQRPVTLEIEMSFSNGQARFYDVVVNPATGEIFSVSEPAPMQPAATFGEQLEKFSMTPERHAADVAAWLTR